MKRGELQQLVYGALERAAAPHFTLDDWIFAWRGEEAPQMEAPNYTSSLQSAIELVEEVDPSLHWLIGKGRLTAEEPLYAAMLLRGEEKVAEAEHKTSPAMALIMALLLVQTGEA